MSTSPTVLADQLAAGADAPRQRPIIRRILPRTLFGRALMIIVTPLLLMQAVATYYFYDRHWDIVTRRLATSVAGEIALVVDLMGETDPAAWPALFERAEATMQLTFRIEPGARLEAGPEPSGFPMLQYQLTRALRSRVDRPFTLDPRAEAELALVRIEIPSGVLDVEVPRQRLFSSTSQVFFLWMVGSGVLLFAVAIAFMHKQIRPIRRLAVAAESFGKGRDVPDFKPEGAVEVRQAARAFLVMRERIQRQIAQRTDMLAGVSHDLRTPLTRMKLQLAMLGDGPEIEELKGDVVEMERMIEGYLAFARGEGGESPELLDLSATLADLVGQARRAGSSITLGPVPELWLPLRPQAFRRCLANLLANARRHAARTWVQARQVAGGMVEILVDDDGPGIPEGRWEEVFRPFVRIEPSRNPRTGGTGLGLTIARDIARAHGGDVRLGHSPEGGLRCVVRLPV
jgi:two-component system osmolarity sensor histidine kinase EnvZ